MFKKNLGLLISQMLFGLNVQNTYLNYEIISKLHFRLA